MQYKIRVHADIQGYLHGFDAVVTAVWIARGVTLAYAKDHMTDIKPVGPCGGMQDKYEIAARNKGIGQTLWFIFNGRGRGEGGIGKLAEKADIKQAIRIQAGGPLRVESSQFFTEVLAAGQFHGMALAVVKTQCADTGKAVQSPRKTCCGVLATGKNDQGCLVGQRT